MALDQLPFKSSSQHHSLIVLHVLCTILHNTSGIKILYAQLKLEMIQLFKIAYKIILCLALSLLLSSVHL